MADHSPLGVLAAIRRCAEIDFFTVTVPHKAKGMLGSVPRHHRNRVIPLCFRRRFDRGFGVHSFAPLREITPDRACVGRGPCLK